MAIQNNKSDGESAEKSNVSNNILFWFAVFFVVISCFNFWNLYDSIPREDVTAYATSSTIRLCMGRPSAADLINPLDWGVMSGIENLSASATNPAGNEYVKDVTFSYAIEGGFINDIGKDLNDGDTEYKKEINTTSYSDGNCIYRFRAKATSECEDASNTKYHISINNVNISPVWSNYNNTLTTNFSRLSSWAELPNVTIGKPHQGMINFSGVILNVDDANLNANVNVSRNNVSIMVGVEHCLNRPATISLYNLTFISPKIMRNNELCPDIVCELLRYEDGNITFSVTDFGESMSTRYYIAENSSAVIRIFDDTDNYTRYINQNVKFYANLTTANQKIINGSDVFCEVQFNLSGEFTSPVNMTFNHSTLYYEFNRSFTRTGTRDWRAICNADARELGIQNATSNFTISNLPPVLISLIPNQTWLQNAILTGMDMDDYFMDPEGQPMWYSHTPVSDIEISFDEYNIVTLTPRRAWFGNRSVVFYAYDDYNASAESNLVQLTVLYVPPPKPSESTGSSSEEEPCTSNWSCSNWGPCLYTNISARKCIDINGCEDNRTRPLEYWKCIYIPSCYDLIKNNGETGVDCGGLCLPCPSCTDLIQNHGEEGIDCGGLCLPCPSCSDGIKNQDETGIDCGGQCPSCSLIEIPASPTSRKPLIAIIITISTIIFTLINLKRIESAVNRIIEKYALLHKAKITMKDRILKARERALLELDKLAKEPAGRKSAEGAKELSFIMRTFFKEVFLLNYEFTSKEFLKEVSRSELNRHMKLLAASFFNKIEQMEFSGFRTGKEELNGLIHQGRTIISSVAYELSEIAERHDALETIRAKASAARIAQNSPKILESGENGLFDEVKSLAGRAENAINSRKIDEARSIYNEINPLYKILDIEEKEKLRDEIIRIYKRIEVESRKYSSARDSKKSLFSSSNFYRNGRRETAAPVKIAGMILLAIILIASSLLVPKILPSVLKFRMGITGNAFVCTGQICFSPEPDNINTYQGNDTIIYVHVTNPENTSINFTTTVDNPLFTIVEKINATSARINFTPSNSQVGNHVVTIAVRNSNGDIEDLKQPTYTVINVNDPPNITSWSPQDENPIVSENYTIGFLFNYTASDPDIPYGDSLTSYWYLDSNLNSTNATNISYFPGFCSAGYHNVTVVVQDLLGLTDEHYWNANVSNLNRIPVLNSTISDYAWNEDSSISNAFNLDEKFYDLDNLECNGENKDNLTFTSALASGGTPNIIITINQESHQVFLSSSQNWCGNESVVFYANDSYEAVVSNNATLSVNCTPDSPVLSSIGSLTARGAVNFVLTVNASDADITYGDSLSFIVNDTSLFNITTTDPTAANALINFTPDVSDVGVYYLNISVRDSAGLEDYELVELTVSYNNPPVFDEISPQSRYENETFEMKINATDADGDNIAYSAASSNSFPSLSISDSGLMSFSFEQADVGNHSVTVTATDSWGAIDSSTFNFEVKNVNQPPVISGIGNKRAKIEHLFTLLINATDQDIGYGDSLEFALNDTTLFNLSAVNSSRAMLSFTPSEGQIGTYYLMINATDLAGESSNTSFELIIDRNSAPSIGISFMNSTENEHFALDLNAYTTDLDNDPITFSYNLVNESNSTFPHFSMTSYGLIEFTSNKSDVGEHLINISADDGENSTSAIVNFTVFAVDNFPVLESIGNLSATEESLFTMQLNATDIENDPLEFVYSIINGSSFPGFSISPSGFINFTPSSADVGNRTINITVRQTNNHSISDSEVITFGVYHFNHAPNITLYAPSNGNFQMYENSTIIFNHTSSDDDNDTLYFQWLVDSVLQNESANWSYSPDFDSSGRRNITLLVNDTFSAVSQSWNVTVVNVNRAPAYGIFSESSAGFLNGTVNSTNASSEIRLAKNSSSTYYPFGFFTSQILDFSAYNLNYVQINFSSINWSSNLSAGTVISVGIRTSEDKASWSNWTYYSSPASPLNGTSDRYLQYMVNMTTSNESLTPELSEIRIGYAISNMSFPQNINPWWVNLNHFFKDPDRENLTFNYSIAGGSPILSMNIVNGRVQLVPTDSGTAIVSFNATDPNGAIASSNSVMIFVEEIPEIISTVSEAGGGGASAVVIKEKIRETPYFLDIIVPEPITMYLNDTIVAPIKIINRGNVTLKGISLSASSENKNIKVSMTTEEITELAKNEEIKTSVIIESYETYGNYEVIVSADIESPKFSESNKIFVNSIELGSEGPSVVNTKIKYTRDLLSENSACLELNEFLTEAQKAIEASDYSKASKILDSTIRTCKYLITEKKRLYEKPSRFSLPLGRNTIIIAGIIGSVLAMGIIIYAYTRKRFS